MKRKYILFSLALFGLVIGNYMIHERKQSKLDAVHDFEMTKEMKAEGYAQYFHDIKVRFGETESGYAPGYTVAELKKAKANQHTFKKSVFDTIYWGQRGPHNVGGRTRAILVDPDDETNKTWFAGTASGGVWKTTDGGRSWIDLTPEQPNLAMISLCMAPSNHDIIYAGTGEGFGNMGGVTGDGIFVTSDRGLSWEHIESTSGNEDFSYVNKIWVDPADENIVIAATNTGLFKTVNGGDDWTNVYSNYYRVQDLVQNPLNPKTLYAGVNSTGIIRSNDGGDTWQLKSYGISNGLRFSVAVSPVDTSVIFTSAESTESTAVVFVSEDAGENWAQHNAVDDNYINFHNAQGWYNNCLVAHPKEALSVYVAGVYVGLLNFTGHTGDSDPTVTLAETIGTSSFLDFINFGGSFLNGGMSTGIEEEANVVDADFTSVEIRFGAGLSQKAHRFLVPDGEGPGVPSTLYEYQDYVDVPFEVWDTDNNQQLMVSFRDQERDGAFNLITRTEGDDISGREYIFVSGYPYNEATPQTEIVNAAGSNKGGHYEKLLYFFWPTLATGGTWDAQSLPESKISIKYGSLLVHDVKTEIIADGETNTVLHVDHHALVVIPGETAEDDFEMLSGNDGGVGYSANSGQTWKQMSNGFITTQFYGVAKKPGFDQFVGGLQDNGTYISKAGVVATSEVDYYSRIGGDGFECLWHPNGELLMGSIYNNRFQRSTNGGLFWDYADKGIDGDGPFVSRLSFNRNDPFTVFAIGAKGVYKHIDFGNYDLDWQLIAIDESLVLNETASSALHVKVSKADPNIVWAGAGMYKTTLKTFLSTDNGDTFSPITSYDAVEMGYMSGMATHPSDPNTAYIMFSYAKSPKLIRTTDKGQTWEDISGFESSDVSTNGFPDVAVQDLLVMPDNPDVIWVGTEIGIVESEDNGETWHLLDTEFPNVSVHRLKYQDGMVIIGTHGRGIWTAANRGVSVQEKQAIAELEIFPNPAVDILNINIPEDMFGDTKVKLYDISGRLIMQEEHFIVSGASNMQLNIQEYLPGNYILKLESEGVSGTCRLVLQ